MALAGVSSATIPLPFAVAVAVVGAINTPLARCETTSRSPADPGAQQQSDSIAQPYIDAIFAIFSENDASSPDGAFACDDIRNGTYPRRKASAKPLAGEHQLSVSLAEVERSPR